MMPRSGVFIGITDDLRRATRPSLVVPGRAFPDRLMIETDAALPAAPASLRSRPAAGERAALLTSARAVAAARGEDVALLAASTTAAARRFFALPQPQE